MSNAGVGQRLCPECNAELPPSRKKFCSKKCGTRQRVRRHRENNPVTKRAQFEKEQNRRSAVVNGAAGSGRLRDVGLTITVEILLERQQKAIRQAQIAGRKALRTTAQVSCAESKQRQKKLFQAAKAQSTREKKLCRELMRQLKQDITASDAQIAHTFEMRTAQEFDERKQL